MEELQLSLESAGASKVMFTRKLIMVVEVAFNPITNNSIKRTLSRICKQELCNVVVEEIDLIAKACGVTQRKKIVLDQNAFRVGEKFSRLPFKMDSPENILCQAHGQSRPITDFLHENVLDFVSDETMDDAWTVCCCTRWHAIRKPKHKKIEQSLSRNQKEMLRQKFTADGGSSSLSKVSVIATEYRPVLKWVGYRKAGDIETHESD
ncbi:hypothetical protein F3Y22_tig00111769pilonHSYRG00273 [Hibiscus syriacus]|uniref:Uncharacterized protein n=1 Tax=Hibiscus syriacus TaxID=106335 RepID=A0A6A2XF22_HIBSY|nr:hypothetical protein F3Y22_tig00111769pilonHSYRG00273 [Hibiscus syriacus]